MKLYFTVIMEKRFILSKRSDSFYQDKMIHFIKENHFIKERFRCRFIFIQRPPFSLFKMKSRVEEMSDGRWFNLQAFMVRVFRYAQTS